VCLDPASDALLKKVNGLIQDCVDSHVACAVSESESVAKPKRLLRIDGPVYLCSPEQPVRYAALSYCWGGHSQHQTLRSNVSTRHESIDPSTLPQTLKDGIFFAKGLGLDYIWIDAICIVQDDIEEWAQEAAKMADVYSGAYVVLAATRAKEATEGFLQPHREPLEIESRMDAGRTFRVQARLDSNHNFLESFELDKLPLSQRGWCLQEQLLASRIVHFCPSEVLYECRSLTFCECGACPGTLDDDTLDDGEEGGWPPKRHSEDARDPLTLRWIRIVEDCSKRRFTYPEDVLPALSGLAQRSASTQSGTYIAGVYACVRDASQECYHQAELLLDHCARPSMLPLAIGLPVFRNLHLS
jgi:hypothetical protein